MRFDSRQEFARRKRPDEIIVSLGIRHGVVFTSSGSNENKWNRTGLWIGLEVAVQSDPGNSRNGPVAHNEVGLFGAKGRECTCSALRKRYTEVRGEKPGERIARDRVVVHDEDVALNIG